MVSGLYCRIVASDIPFYRRGADSSAAAGGRTRAWGICKGSHGNGNSIFHAFNGERRRPLSMSSISALEAVVAKSSTRRENQYGPKLIMLSKNIVGRGVNWQTVDLRRS